jgi:TPR repeat protein
MSGVARRGLAIIALCSLLTELGHAQEITVLQRIQKFTKQGFASAQYQRGVAYATGHGAPQDDAEAVRWYRLAAENGHAEAQLALGFKYAYGSGVPENDAEAQKWYRLAADQGYAAAQRHLGFIYTRGDGVPENFVEAFKWFNLLAAQGDKEAAGFKENLRKTMTQEQIAEAQRLSAAWKPKQ